MQNKIAIILPFKEYFNDTNSGAASIFVKESLAKVKINDYIIYGSSINKKKISKKYKKIFYRSYDLGKFFTNYNYINSFIKRFENTGINKFEIHNRPEYAIKIKKKFKNSKILIYFHNDPDSLKGSETLEKKKYLDSNFRLVFLSKWIKKKFYKDFIIENKNNPVLYPGGKINKKNYKKENIIFYCGKLNKSKGYDVFLEATKMLIQNKNYKSWKIISAGFEKRRDIPYFNHVKEMGQVSNEKVYNIYSKAKISVAPSKWDEPLGRLPIESLSQLCIPITSNKGGLTETNTLGIVLKNNTPLELYKKLIYLCSDEKKIKKFQKNINNKFKLTDIFFQSKIKKIRGDFFNNKVQINKVLYISNFNYKSKDRLFYSFANKIKLGLKQKRIKTDFISDRDFMRSNKSLIDINGIKKFNQLILNYIKKNNYNLIILGHTEKISLKTFEIIKTINPNIKIIKMYIDSLSKEFFDFNKTFYDFDYLDKIFATSSNKIIEDRYRYKFHFIPYPVNKRIDYLKSYEARAKKYDVFFAISHGQNRGILKKGRVDEREKNLKKLKVFLDKKNISSLFIGLNNIQPKWGKQLYEIFKQSKICLNISRGKYKDLYSSDRISSLSGNGCFVLNEKINQYNKLFNNNQIASFSNYNDLKKKILYYLKDDKMRVKNSKANYVYWHKHYNTDKVINYIFDIINEEKSLKKYAWSEIK